MLGFLLIYFIWKYYSELAVEHNKSKWGYALLGIATYYIGTFIGGLHHRFISWHRSRRIKHHHSKPYRFAFRFIVCLGAV